MKLAERKLEETLSNSGNGLPWEICHCLEETVRRLQSYLRQPQLETGYHLTVHRYLQNLNYLTNYKKLMSCLMEFLHLLNWHNQRGHNVQIINLLKALPSTNLPFMQLHRHLTINLNVNSDFFLYSWNPNLTYYFNFEFTCFRSLLSFSNWCCCDRLSARFKTREDRCVALSQVAIDLWGLGAKSYGNRIPRHSFASIFNSVSLGFNCAMFLLKVLCREITWLHGQSRCAEKPNREFSSFRSLRPPAEKSKWAGRIISS